MQAARVTRVFRPLLARRPAPVRLMSGGHGHGHGQAKAPLPKGEGFFQKHPDYTGPEAYVRYYLPENYHLVYAVLGVYINLVAFALIRNNAATEKAMLKQPEPTAPDYTTPLPESSSLPSFGSAEWEALMATAEGPQALLEAGLAFIA